MISKIARKFQVPISNTSNLIVSSGHVILGTNIGIATMQVVSQCLTKNFRYIELKSYSIGPVGCIECLKLVKLTLLNTSIIVLASPESFQHVLGFRKLRSRYPASMVLAQATKPRPKPYMQADEAFLMASAVNVEYRKSNE